MIMVHRLRIETVLEDSRIIFGGRSSQANEEMDMLPGLIEQELENL
jgi:hypothetical protein